MPTILAYSATFLWSGAAANDEKQVQPYITSQNNVYILYVGT